MNAIDDDMPIAIQEAVKRADSDSEIHVIVLAGAGRAFCSGYDLAYYAHSNSTENVVQQMPWDPIQDYLLQVVQLMLLLVR